MNQSIVKKNHFEYFNGEELEVLLEKYDKARLSWLEAHKDQPIKSEALVIHNLSMLMIVSAIEKLAKGE